MSSDVRLAPDPLWVIDAHLHLWDSTEDPPADWGGGRAIRRENLLDEMNRAGVDAAVLVPPGAVSGWSNVASIELAEAMPRRFRLVGVLPPNDQEALAEFDSWKRRDVVRGLRCSFSSEPGRTWARIGPSAWIWRACENRGLPVMVNAPGRLDLIGDLARTYPALKLVVDHLGLAESDASLPLGPRIEPLLRLGELANIAVKASALPLQALGPYPFDRVQGVIRQVVDVFGPKRVFWGSDLSRLKCPYREVLDLFCLPGLLSPAEREWVLGRGVGEWLGWRRS